MEGFGRYEGEINWRNLMEPTNTDKPEEDELDHSIDELELPVRVANRFS